MIHFEETIAKKDGIPLVWEVIKGKDSSIVDVCAWLAEQKTQIQQALDCHGAVLLRGFENIKSAEEFERILGVLAPRLMDYVGGTSPRGAVRGSIMTATDLPGNYSIPMHQEMSYTRNPPDRVAFFCEVPATGGGMTTVADARLITRRIDPSVRQRFERRKGIRLRRTLPAPESVNSRPGVPKPWTQVFDTIDRAQAEHVAARKGWEVIWLADGSLQLWQEILPACKTHPRTGDTVWFNQAHIFAPEAFLKWARRDGRDDQWRQVKETLEEDADLVDHVFHGDGTQVSADDARYLFDVFMNSEVPVHWRRGDVLFLDNVLAVHGRTGFTGDRRVLAALILDQAEPPVESKPEHEILEKVGA